MAEIPAPAVRRSLINYRFIDARSILVSVKHLIDAEGKRLPVKLDATSNGEFVPVPLSPTNQAANRCAHEAATKNAQRLGLSRRDFLISACGVATTLLAFNSVNAMAGKRGGFFEVESEAAFEPQLRRPVLAARASLFSMFRGTSLIQRMHG